MPRLSPGEPCCSDDLHNKITTMLVWLPTGITVDDGPMGFEITLRDKSTEFIDEADAFAHEKSMTTFYRTANSRQTIDCWAISLASVRTDQILMIRRTPHGEPPAAPQEQAA